MTGKQHLKTAYLVIIFTVILFNLANIIIPVFLIGDDGSFYRHVEQIYFTDFKSFNPATFLSFSFVGDYILFFLFSSMEQFSVYFARSVFLGFMVIVSLLFFRLLHLRLGLSRITSLGAAIIPNILAYNFLMPGYIIGSYIIHTLMFFLLTLEYIFKYLDSDSPPSNKKTLYLILVILLSLVFTMSSSQALFFYPFIFLLIAVYKAHKNKKLFLFILIAIQFLFKFIWMLTHPRKLQLNPGLSEILDRIHLYFQWGLPFPYFPSELLITLFFLVFLVAVYFIYIRGLNPALQLNPRFIFQSDKKYTFFLLIFLAGWMLSTVFANMFLRKVGWQFRFCYASFFAFLTIFIFSLDTLILRLKRFRLDIIVLAILILSTGIYKLILTSEHFKPLNSSIELISTSLREINLPANSQLIITGQIKGPSNVFRKNTGVLQYLLSRRDITGQIANDRRKFYGFTRHFQPFEWRLYLKGRYMTGYSLDKPLFILKRKSGKMRQQSYVLEWLGNSKRSPWIIYKLHEKTGKIRPFLKGRGLDDYLLKVKNLSSQGIHQDDIVFGESYCVKDLRRLRD